MRYELLNAIDGGGARRSGATRAGNTTPEHHEPTTPDHSKKVVFPAFGTPQRARTVRGADKHIYILGTDAKNDARLAAIEAQSCYVFHSLMTYNEVFEAGLDKIPATLFEAHRRLAAAQPAADGVMTYWDLPFSLMVPLLRRRANLPGPSLESTLRCEHKYWARLQQAGQVEGCPEFHPVDPADPQSVAAIPFVTPYWIKPIKGYLGQLAYRITNQEEQEEAIRAILAKIHRLAQPFNYLAGLAHLPSAIAPITGSWCIAEKPLSGRPCTLEGYTTMNGETVVYGIIDSVRYKDASAFGRYIYPSQVPVDIQRRMQRLAETLMPAIGFAGGTFNMELFWDPASRQIGILEVNSRHSQSHAPLFALVDGLAHHKVMADLAVAATPQMPRRRGAYAQAAKCMARSFGNAKVLRVPTEAELAEVRAACEVEEIVIPLRCGDQLADRWEEDAYSTLLAEIYIGGETTTEIDARYQRCCERLADYLQFDDSAVWPPPPNALEPYFTESARGVAI